MAVAGILLAGYSGLGSLIGVTMAVSDARSNWPPLSLFLKDIAVVGGIPFVIGLIVLFAGLAVVRRTE